MSTIPLPRADYGIVLCGILERVRNKHAPADHVHVPGSVTGGRLVSVKAPGIPSGSKNEVKVSM